MRQIALATEDALSEAVGEKLIAEVKPPLQVGLRLRRDGFGYLKTRMWKFCEIARHQPVLVITDLDRMACAATLVRGWTANDIPPATLLLRVAVREVEAWLLADHDAMRTLLQQPRQILPPDPEDLPEPKEALIQLVARHGPRSLREAIVPQPGVIAAQGLGYNNVLMEFVRRTWSPHRAARQSNSLARARQRLRELAASVSPSR